MAPRKNANAKKMFQIKEGTKLLYKHYLIGYSMLLMGFGGYIGYLNPYISTTDHRYLNDNEI